MTTGILHDRQVMPLCPLIIESRPFNGLGPLDDLNGLYPQLSPTLAITSPHVAQLC